MPFRGALVSRGMYMGVSIDQMTNDGYFPTHMGVSIDQMTNDGYFPTQIDHFHLLEG